ncbi:hypothetical protein WMY93_006129 [Mugilogobius chulae]|uniref:Uncharacterized protein n=1 Tax=Mugilogobius chulae TaxID=88201 RepID=A0AAW0PSX7_9GOBI
MQEAGPGAIRGEDLEKVPWCLLTAHNGVPPRRHNSVQREHFPSRRNSPRRIDSTTSSIAAHKVLTTADSYLDSTIERSI